MFYIYHIPGVKIGCTELDPAIRIKQQGYQDFEVLEQYEDGWHAGDRELILQAEYGYRIDRFHYMISRQNATRMVKHTEDTKLKMSISKKGIPKSAEHKNKISITNGSRVKYECPHCGILIGGKGNLTQHLKKHT